MNEVERTVPEARAAGTAAGEVTRQPERYAVPPVDIYEEGDALIVLADLPGVSKDGLDVQVEQGILTIQGRAARDTPGQVLNREFAYASFFRQFRITESVDTEKIRAKLLNGVLRLELPKAEAAKPRRIQLEI
ncbi:MAG: Hsp20/alpha crystallin family protein [Deltaproteobacteria bacterium]|nr:Hsp20/alpha crystallin family protein [Deltaproteobacteria bacterium]